MPRPCTGTLATHRLLYLCTLLVLVLIAVLPNFTTATTSSPLLTLQDDPDPPVVRNMAVKLNGYGEFASTIDFYLAEFTNLDIPTEKAIWSLGATLNTKISVDYDSIYEYGTNLKDGRHLRSTELFTFKPSTTASSEFEFDVDFTQHDGEDEPFALSDVESWWVRVYIHPASLPVNTKLSQLKLTNVYLWSHATKSEWVPTTPEMTFPFAPTIVAADAEKYHKFVQFYETPASDSLSQPSPSSQPCSKVMSKLASAMIRDDDLNDDSNTRTTLTDPAAQNIELSRSFRVTFPAITQAIKYESDAHYYALTTNGTLKSLDPPVFAETGGLSKCTLNTQQVNTALVLSDVTNTLFVRFMPEATFTPIPVGTDLVIDCTTQIVAQLDQIRYNFLQWDFMGVVPIPDSPGDFKSNVFVQSWVQRPYQVDPNPDPEPIDPVMHRFHVVTSLGAKHSPFTNLTIDHFPVDAGSKFDLSVQFTAGYVQSKIQDCFIVLVSQYKNAQGGVESLVSRIACRVELDRHIHQTIEFALPDDHSEIIDFQVDVTLFPESLEEQWGLTQLHVTSQTNKKTYILPAQERKAAVFEYNPPLGVADDKDGAIVVNYYSANGVKKYAQSRDGWSKISRQFEVKVNKMKTPYIFDQLIVMTSAASPIAGKSEPRAALKMHFSGSNTVMDCPVLNYNTTQDKWTNDYYGYAQAKLSPQSDYLHLFINKLRSPIVAGSTFTIYCPDVWVEADALGQSGKEPWAWGVTMPLKDAPEYFVNDVILSAISKPALEDGTDGVENPYYFDEEETSNTKYILFGVMLGVVCILIAAYFIIRHVRTKQKQPKVQPTNLLTDSEYAMME